MLATQPGHIAVVPLAALDAQAETALDYAATLAPRVVAVHVRQAACDFEARWAARSPSASLVLIDTPAANWKSAFVRAVNALKHTEHARRVTVVVPHRPANPHAAHRWGLSSAASLRLALGPTLGVVVSTAPREP